MRVVHSFDELATVAETVCIAIGVFDGVHRGHQSVIRAALDDAKAVDGTAVVLTFDPHPMRVLAPDRAPALLTSTEHKLALLESLGVPVCLMVRFTKEFARTEPEPFLNLLFQSAKNLKSICVGHAFQFGHQRKGDVQTILAFGRARGVRVDVLPPVTDGGEVISSTTIRKAVTAGDLAKVERMLGRPFSVLGTVEAGDRLGRKLGYPTANLNPHHELLPPNGVYAAQARLDGRTRIGMVNIGVRPTVSPGGSERRLEVHIFDFDGDLYGRSVEVVFVRKLREERKFDSPEALKEQIQRDEAEARSLFARAGDSRRA